MHIHRVGRTGRSGERPALSLAALNKMKWVKPELRTIGADRSAGSSWMS